MRKKFLPEDIEDLTSMYYDQSRLKDKTKYESGFQNILAGWQEKEIQEIFNNFGKCEKIPRATQKTFDFKVDESKLVFDVTTINPPTDKHIIDGNPKWITNKIQDAITHILEKNSTGFSEYLRGGVIYCSSVLVSLTDICSMLDKVVPGLMADLDFLVFVPQAASIGGKSSRELYPTKAFVKNSNLFELFTNKLSKNYKIIKI